MKTREQWEIWIKNTFDNPRYFISLGAPKTKMKIVYFTGNLEDKDRWGIKPVSSCFYVAFPSSEQEAKELAANCEWEVVS